MGEILISDKIKILWMSDSINVPTGYGNVTRNILTRLNKKKFDVAHFGWQTVGQPHTIYGITTYPIGKDRHGKDILKHHLDTIKPDIFIELCDMWMADYVLDMDFSPAKFLMYFPLDGEPIPYGCHRHLLKADIAIAMSKYGLELANRSTFRNNQTKQLEYLKDHLTSAIRYIPHGVDTNIFKPLKKKEKEKLRAEERLTDKFVIGMVSRNQPRKMLPRLLKAYKIFAKDKKDVQLYLHCDPKDPQGYNLLPMIERLELPAVKFTKLQSYKYGIPPEILNKVYNLFDIHTIPTSGEGFGLTILESMSAGVPNVLTDYTTSRELIEGCGELVELEGLLLGSMIVERGLIDIKDYVKKLDFLYYNRDIIEKYSKICRKRALEYDWKKKIIPQWERLFQEVVSK